MLAWRQKFTVMDKVRFFTRSSNVLSGRVNIVLVLGMLLAAGLVVFYLIGIDSRRNSVRLKDVQAITTALHQYTADHGGNLPADLDNRVRQIGTARSGCELDTAQCSIAQSTDCIDLGTSLEPYLKDTPTDPASGSVAYTHYAVRAERGGGFLVIACDYSE